MTIQILAKAIHFVWQNAASQRIHPEFRICMTIGSFTQLKLSVQSYVVYMYNLRTVCTNFTMSHVSNSAAKTYGELYHI